MTEWPSDAQLDEAATRVADKLFQMMTEAGAWSQPPVYGPDGQHHPQVSEQEGFRGAVYQHSDQFKILDPVKIGDEFTRMKNAASSTGQDSQAVAILRSAQASLSSTWHGDAAKAFALQMTHVETFMLKQERCILNAMQRVGALYGMATFDPEELPRPGRDHHCRLRTRTAGTSEAGHHPDGEPGDGRGQLRYRSVQR